MSVLITVLFFVVPVVVLAETVLLVLMRKQVKGLEKSVKACDRRVQRADLAALVAAKSNVSVDDVDMHELDGFLD